MPEAARPSRPIWPWRHEVPAIDEAALVAARDADRLLAAAEERGITRWAAYLRPMPDRLRDGDLRDVRLAAMRARAAYGPKDSIRDALPAELTEPFLASIDRLLKALARRELRSET
jgi:hypothetical protein